MFTDAEKDGYNVKPKRVQSEETKQKISIGVKRKEINREYGTTSEETKKKIRKSTTGLKRTEEQKQKMRDAWVIRKQNKLKKT
tara:strand:+ start:1868 stop:2116 length:249 start_codon:yes stop_codon:yes gene_type:complete